ncbi:hypothetical protein EsDP_00003819 [Epichloe bromicola]|uniref:trimethyllysine dioxygenase n=1 Tax=Epichloe bromicola TaxID=79588 RepID=A0ABQ0CPV7_9HYPO
MAVSLGTILRSSRPIGIRGTRLFTQAPKPHHIIRSFVTCLGSDSNGLILKSDAAGKSTEKRLSNLWLREVDIAPCHADDWKIARDIAPTTIQQHEERVDVTWSDSHESTYTWSWLRSTLHGSETKELNVLHEKLWNSAIASDPPRVPYDSVMDKGDIKGMAELTSKIREWGLCFVTGTPKTPEATEKLLEAIGPIRNTHYGGFYDFVPDLAKADTAYTNLALAAHTDTTYFTEPAGLQAFHMLSHTPPPNKTDEAAASLGGQSLLVDGFYAAHRLRKEFPDAYEVLRKARVPWHSSGNQGVAIAPDRAYPVIDASSKKVFRIRWNNDDRGVIPLHLDVNEWYLAASRWNSILRRKQNEYWFQLESGQVLIFDNWRVLHGRSAFEGLRRICGGYINRDDFISRWKASNFPSDEVIAANMQLR